MTRSCDACDASCGGTRLAREATQASQLHQLKVILAMACHVSKAEFARYVEQALAELPEPFASLIEEVPVQIEQRPSARLLRSLEMDEDGLLLGLYRGASLLNRVEAEGRGSPVPNHILIFQEDVELASDSEADLVREIRTTVLHELGHHLGMDEDDLDEIGYG